jgi:hypothetical protein
MDRKPLALYHGYWADSDGLILTVCREESGLLIRVLKSDRRPDGARNVLIRESDWQAEDVEGAKKAAENHARSILARPLSSAALQWREYEDLGLLIRLL